MTYPDQKIVAKRLNAEVRRDMRAMENAGLRVIKASWDETKVHLKGAIASNIIHDFGTGRWNAGQARRRGTFLRIERAVKTLLDTFVSRNAAHMVPYLREARFAEMSRTLWMMSQLVPPSIPIHIPLGHHRAARAVREADLGGGLPNPGEPDYVERLNAWLQAYRDSLTHNLNLGAINGGTLEDAIAEVDATKIGSPSVQVWDAIERLFATTFIRQTQGPGGGHDDAMDANPDAPFVEVWHAYADGKVCDECASYDGQTRDEVEDMNVDDVAPGDVHPYCRCWYAVEPRQPWGDLAGDARASGYAPTTMLLRGPDGRVGGVGIISYGDWIGPNLSNLTQARRAAGLQ